MDTPLNFALIPHSSSANETFLVQLNQEKFIKTPSNMHLRRHDIIKAIAVSELSTPVEYRTIDM